MNTSFVKQLVNLIKPQARFKSSSSISKPIRFDNQTAIITGAGRGLGKQYALLLASRGANVVINDFGGSKSGEQVPEGERIADQVVEEILASGGRAIASHESVGSEEGAQKVVDCALKEFGRVDILINNAGILRDKSFAKLAVQDWDQVCSIHLRAPFLVSRACWPAMRKQHFGRIVMTSSTSALFGNFGQANYAAAKMALIGLSNTLAIEGKTSNINCNTIVPMAVSRMTRDIIPEELAKHLNPAYVAPLVAWLCHSDCAETGQVFEAAGKWFGRYRLERSRGKYLAQFDEPASMLDQIADSWKEICQFDEQATEVESFGEHLAQLMQLFETSNEEEEPPIKD